MSDTPAVNFKLLTDEQKEYAANNLNELEEIRDEKIEEIRQWILKSEDLCARIGKFLNLYHQFCKACCSYEFKDITKMNFLKR